MPDSPAADDTLRAALHGARGLLLDLDGVLVLAGKAVPGAPEALAELDRRGFPYLVVTNTSLVSRASLARWGRSVGFATPADRFQSALSASVELVRREFGERPVYVISSDDAGTEFAGLNVLDGAGADAAPDEVAAVILGDSPDQLTKANLDRAFRLVRRGAALIGMHRNPWWITPEGPTLDAGAFLVALEWATKRRARTVGKPSPAFFRVAIDRLAAEAAARGEPRLARADLVMVGDDVGSDIGGARRAGLRTVFVRTGKHGDAELADAASRTRGAYAPDAVAPSIAEVVAALG
jgi:HAD superfamily hydrolase (TIGR01450 family)